MRVRVCACVRTRAALLQFLVNVAAGRTPRVLEFPFPGAERVKQVYPIVAAPQALPSYFEVCTLPALFECCR